MSKAKAEREDLLRGPETTFRILEAVRELDKPGVTQISNHLSIPKSTVHNHLHTLECLGYLSKTDNVYTLDLRLLRLGAATRNQWPICKLSKHEVTKLAQKTGEIANLAVYDGGEMVILYKDSGEKAVNIDIHTGSRLSIHATAMGKAILSQMSDDTVDEILREIDLDNHTENTITTKDKLRKELIEIRRTGVAFDREERVHGLNCAAVPIRKDDDVVGTISVSGPTSRLKGKYFEEELPQLLHDIANVIELNFRYKDSALNV